ncbi:uncharacterized protein LOC116416000 [Nasonia vitripennis]|uniref:Uncharacterized protein n=1 Tax=Nasonia vitripennis TaxID=7425 RepID=A0A7M7PY84_NASVI|nr:uncharacterized protein LOC116416000 [Nasonia vitripennis]
MYVDDLLTDSDSLDDILKARDEIITVLKRGGFNIRQWASNHNHALDNLDEKVLSQAPGDETNTVLKTLGVTWASKRDELAIVVKLMDVPPNVTKRIILSEIAKIFNPIGLVGPVCLHAKWIMQECWKEKISWDESVPQNLFTLWMDFASQLSSLFSVSAPRHVVCVNPSRIEIDGFSDTSKKGYGTCLYARSTDRNGKITVRLVCSKSRVAPLKEQTIPRLELCGAVTLVRLLIETLPALEFSIDRIVLWFDSTIVLHWLRKSPQDLKLFEANRVREIQELVERASWRYVPTQHNPADALSRGQLPKEFLRNDTWFTGLLWLRHTEASWPANIVESTPV